jgi:hypothetical protein
VTQTEKLEHYIVVSLFFFKLRNWFKSCQNAPCLHPINSTRALLAKWKYNISQREGSALQDQIRVHLSLQREASASGRRSSLSRSGFTQINLKFSGVQADSAPAVSEHDALLMTLKWKCRESVFRFHSYLHTECLRGVGYYGQVVLIQKWAVHSQCRDGQSENRRFDSGQSQFLAPRWIQIVSGAHPGWYPMATERSFSGSDQGLKMTIYLHQVQSSNSCRNIQNDSKLLSAFPWLIIFNSKIIKYNCLRNMKV